MPLKMEQENEVEVDNLEETTEEVALEATEEESVEELKAKLTKAESYGKNQKIRAEKAEQEAKENKGKVETKAQDLSAKDIFALAKGDVAEEDFDEVINYAKYRNITPAEALKDKTLKTILAERSEERQTAQATVTRSARPSATQTSEVVLGKAERGDLPTKDEDIDKLAEARMQAKLNNKS